MISDSWIQYGSLGVLFIVLTGVGYWLRWYTKETQAFIRDLVDKIAEERGDWKGLVQSSAEASASTASALSQIVRELETISAHQREGMEALREGQGEIMTRMRLREMK